ncbi:MAG: hypothetical protein QNJ55_15165 [Xenococcus sp. MO_188.B8]|nr:hypothetical protein [Xenococcus sp. MO_188.B8]
MNLKIQDLENLQDLTEVELEKVEGGQSAEDLIRFLNEDFCGEQGGDICNREDQIRDIILRAQELYPNSASRLNRLNRLFAVEIPSSSGPVTL